MRAFASALIALWVVLAPAGARAQDIVEGSTVAWKPAWHRYGEVDLVVSAALGVTLAGAYVSLEPRPEGFRGGLLFDDDIRGWLRSDSEPARLRAHDVSTAIQNAMVVVPYAVDSLALGLLYQGSSDTALQIAAINTQAFLTTATITLLTKNLTSRQRPYVESCGGGSCGGGARNKSFISGHAAASFTAAGLVCAHHEHLPLFDNAWADGSMCAGMIAFASASSLLRISSDEHYATDVLAGAAVGMLSGYLLPKLIYYGGFGDDAADDDSVAFGE